MHWNKIASTAFIFGLLTLPLHAGDMTPPSGPDTYATYTLEDIYQRLLYGTIGSQTVGYHGPVDSPDATMHNLNDIMNEAPKADNTNGATPSDVLKDKTFWGLRTDGSWGPQAGTAEDSGGCTGDAGAADVLTGKTFSNAVSTGINGAMPNVGKHDVTPGDTDQIIPQGYHDGSGVVAGDPDLVPDNIINGVEIFGVTGSHTDSATCEGNAVTGDVLSGTTFSNASATGLTGTMPNVGAQTITPSISGQNIDEGYHNGNGTVAGDADLVTDNIKAGVNIFGVAGKTEVVDTSSGDALNTDLKSGKKAWVDGSEVEGTMPDSTQDITPSNTEQSIAAGYHDGTGKVLTDGALVSGNIRNGSTIFGVSGDSNVVDTRSGDAAAGDIVDGKKAWVDGLEVTGNVSVGSSLNGANGLKTIPIPDGFYSGKTVTANDSNLIPANIKSGVTIFGVQGSYSGCYSIGDTGPGGGIIYYIEGGLPSGCHGYEVAPTQTSPVLWSQAFAAASNYSTLQAPSGWVLPRASEESRLCNIKDIIAERIFTWTSDGSILYPGGGVALYVTEYIEGHTQCGIIDMNASTNYPVRPIREF